MIKLKGWEASSLGVYSHTEAVHTYASAISHYYCMSRLFKVMNAKPINDQLKLTLSQPGLLDTFRKYSISQMSNCVQ